MRRSSGRHSSDLVVEGEGRILSMAELRRMELLRQNGSMSDNKRIVAEDLWQATVLFGDARQRMKRKGSSRSFSGSWKWLSAMRRMVGIAMSLMRMMIDLQYGEDEEARVSVCGY